MTDVRHEFIGIIQNRDMDIESRIRKVLSMAKDVQKLADEGNIFEIADIFSKVPGVVKKQ